ncbi:uncharacterized protein TOT_010000193 [Theileria orientalis strain Shintoku]|uniref:Uncharacterized protein n=1 Tax=Theileria orientalis strain Shintoku TaxID=869250 RepID=J7M4L1_THEOR|nr:uncharacterized protein TOT_010000193 [Theileria orientalis strain Shintoku]PVC54304.1 hypothetical protein MACL_00003175 [Theileria orientalis]BAM38725.1 uncharacterized protein TOT_010000193 [Theileria orientalis strain Shintoku]|eukprot:XP_009689026.1 uncharacterized protein TOT_010000193 [Theileria orientalis strain Shintoku]
MYSYSRHSSRLFRHIPLKNAPIPRKCKFNFVNKSFYSNILDHRLKSSLESARFIKSVNNICLFPRYDHINTFLNKYNVSFATQSINLSTSSNTIEVSSEDQVTEMTDEAMFVEDKICSTEVPKSECPDVFGKFKGEPLLGEEFGAVYTKHEPTMFGDWSHMGRVTDF